MSELNGDMASERKVFVTNLLNGSSPSAMILRFNTEGNTTGNRTSPCRRYWY